MDLFKDIISSLNTKPGHIFDKDPESIKDYVPYIVNMSYYFGNDTLLYANEMNIRGDMDKKMQYDFYYYGIPKGRRYNKFLKPKVINNIDMITEYYQCSNKKAKEYIDVLTDEQIEIIRGRMYKGEIINDKRKRKKRK